MRVLTSAIVAFATSFVIDGAAFAASGPDAAQHGSIAGTADPGAQVVVTGGEDHIVVGVVGTADGTYHVDGLRPGAYQIKEGGAHHATRTVGVQAGQVSAVDLRSSGH